MPTETLEELQPATLPVWKQPTLLIIDDDEALSESLSRRLAQQGYETLLAATAAEGLRLAGDARPSLILLDLRLPDADGLTVAAQLADAPETCHIPVILLSGTERSDIIRCSRAAGCQYFVRKPYDPSALLILIRHALQEALQWDVM